MDKLTPTQQKTLNMIAEHDPNKTHWTIGTARGMTSPRFRALQEKGMIACQPNPTWHGAKVEITEKGRIWLKEHIHE